MYTDKVMDHFSNPRNVGEIENADGVGEVGLVDHKQVGRLDHPIAHPLLHAPGQQRLERMDPRLQQIDLADRLRPVPEHRIDRIEAVQPQLRLPRRSRTTIPGATHLSPAGSRNRRCGCPAPADRRSGPGPASSAARSRAARSAPVSATGRSR